MKLLESDEEDGEDDAREREELAHELFQEDETVKNCLPFT